ncbi:MAG: hypothetical protein AAB660_01515 [Patescibacteria group bacterium]
MKLYKNILPVGLLLFPLVTFAQLTKTGELIIAVGSLTRQAIVVVAGLALLVFMWGLVKFIFKIGGDEKAIEEGKNLMKWGLVALFVMVAVWGIIGFFQKELGIDGVNQPQGGGWWNQGSSASI